ncbi:recombinase family protein [Paenibacillus sp.]|uniref:recombinase family protein n=1 Tax=Paenibacillus sp. TaxID=58172 RepID=UPI00356513ED
MTITKAALYIRVSSEEQVEGYSIEGQLEGLRERCLQHDLSIFKEYVDAGKSAKSIKGRKALQELLVDAERGQFQIVLVWKLNRLARNLKDLLHMLNVFNKNNVSIESMTEEIKTDSAMGNFIVQMLGATAELERGQICENVQLGIQERNRQGRWNSGNMVLGYRWHQQPKPGQPQLEVVAEEAKIVWHIFNLYADGLGLKAITNRLNAEGFRTKKGLSFSIAAVRGILTNPNYIGKIRIGTSLRRSNPGAEVQLVDGEHDPLISQALWDKVQSRYEKHSRQSTKTVNRHFPLTRLLKCPECGYSMIAAHTKNKNKNGTIRQNYYYVCSHYTNKGASACRSNHVRADDIEQWFFRQIQELVMSPRLLRQIVAAVNRKRDIDRKPLELERKRLKKELADFEKRQQRCFELFEEGLIDHIDFAGRLSELKEQQTVLQSAINEVEQKLSNPQIDLLHIDSIQSSLKQFQNMFRMASMKQQKQLLRSLFDKITLSHDRDISKAVIYGSNQLQQLQLTGQMEEEQWKTNNKLA